MQAGVEAHERFINEIESDEMGLDIGPKNHRSF